MINITSQSHSINTGDIVTISPPLTEHRWWMRFINWIMRKPQSTTTAVVKETTVYTFTMKRW